MGMKRIKVQRLIAEQQKSLRAALRRLEEKREQACNGGFDDAPSSRYQ